jgi:hypothetical protein
VALAVAVVAATSAWAAVSLGVVAQGHPAWPLLVFVGAGSAAAVFLWPRSDPSRWARGAAGEIVTAAMLEALPRARWVVLHDLALPGSRANVDHLVIGPTGIWVVDTKAYRARVTVRWRQVLVAGAPVKTGPVRWESQVVSERLGIATRPVIAMHANGLPRRGRRVDGVRVVPAAQLVRRLKRGARLRRRLGRRRVRQLAELAEETLGRPW